METFAESAALEHRPSQGENVPMCRAQNDEGFNFIPRKTGLLAATWWHTAARFAPPAGRRGGSLRAVLKELCKC
jgi:hypothetical protein